MLSHFDKYEIPVLLLDYDIVPSPERSTYDLVGIDNIAAGLSIGRFLVRKGGNIRLAGFDDVAVAAQIGLTTCRQPLGDLAHVAFQTLLQRIRSPRLPPRTILLPAPLVAR